MIKNPAKRPGFIGQQQPITCARLALQSALIRLTNVYLILHQPTESKNSFEFQKQEKIIVAFSPVPHYLTPLKPL
jgi:hypothetical protein